MPPATLPTEIILVAALDAHRLIGVGGGMPWRLPADLKRFKARTWGHPILMGRTTFEGLGRALPGRRNLVLSRAPGFTAPGAEVFTELDAALAAAASPHPQPASPGALMVIGGAQIYAATLPRATRLVLTLVSGAFTGDTWFPALPHHWQVARREPFPADHQNPFDCEDFELVCSTTEPPEPPPANIAGWFAPGEDDRQTEST